MPEGAATIAAIDPVPDQPALLQVRAGRRRWRLRRVDIEPLHLECGMPITDKLVEQLDAAATCAKAIKAAVALLARGPVARGRLLERLGRRFGLDAAEACVSHLTTAGLLDDDEAAASMRRALERRGPVGPARLARDLIARGVHPDATEAAVNDLAQKQDHVAAAIEAATPMLRSLTRFDCATQARRLAGRLARRGFDPDTVQEVLEHLQLTCGYDEAP